ncbi:MAG: Wzz/FepE/Etk N-terminal domain-containing protein, partial [Cyclobacteriaceae bacterium]
MNAEQDHPQYQDQDILSSFDPEKFKMILSKSWIYLIIFLITTVASAYVYVRYTKPVYESSSVIKLNFESEASVLDISSPVIKQEGEISGEIELLKSRLFFGKVAEAVDNDVSYFRYGRVLDDERFGISPFEVSYKVKNGAYYNQAIDLTILDKETFNLTLNDTTKKYRFGEDISTPDINLLVSKTKNFSSGAEGPYYFIINTNEAIVDFLQENVNVVPESFTAKTLKISILDYNRKKAQVFVNAIDSIYEIYTRDAKNRALEQKIDFLDRRIEATEEVLQSFEDYFENFTIQNRSTNLGNDLTKTIQQLDELDSIQFKLKSRDSEISILKEKLESGEPLINQVFIERFPESIKTLLSEYQLGISERSKKLSSYSENTFVIKQLNEEIDLTKTRLLAVVNGYQDNLKSQISNIASRKALLETSLLQLPSLETEYSKNRRLYTQQ